MQEFTISSLDANQKILKFVKKNLNNLSLSLIYKIFRKRDVKVNGKRIDENYILQIGDIVQIYVPNYLSDPSIVKSIRKVEITFKVIYEDTNILIVNKPYGLLVVEDENEKVNTLANQVLNYLSAKNEYSEEEKGFVPSPVHRIDRNTTGIVIIAKNLVSSQILVDMFRNRKGISKQYLALVKGVIKEPGEINTPLIKDEKTSLVRLAHPKEQGLTALTLYAPIKNFAKFTLLNIVIMTGRTHQIRVHMQSIDHPLIGDAKYGDFNLNKEIKNKYKWENQYLHAQKISFEQVKDNLSYLSYREFNAPLNEKQLKLLDELE